MLSSPENKIPSNFNSFLFNPITFLVAGTSRFCKIFFEKNLTRGCDKVRHPWPCVLQTALSGTAKNRFALYHKKQLMFPQIILYLFSFPYITITILLQNVNCFHVIYEFCKARNRFCISLFSYACCIHSIFSKFYSILNRFKRWKPMQLRLVLLIG